jgi:hypothetical protein
VTNWLMCVKTRAPRSCDARYAGQPQFLSGAVRAMKQQTTTLPIPVKPPVCNGMIAPRDSWMMPHIPG